MPDDAHRHSPAPGLIARVGGRLINRLIRATPRRTIDVPVAEPIVSFTFDDVPDTALTQGAALLEERGARGTFYIAGGLRGRLEPDRRLIDEDGCRELARRGHEIGCHTFSHRNLLGVGRVTLSDDLRQNEHYLSRFDPRAARRNFAFPYNQGSLPLRSPLAETFRSCRAGGEAINRGATDPHFLRAVEIRQPESHVRELTRWIDDLVAKPGWLIFFTHDIAAVPTPYGCTPESFAALIAHAQARGCLILTVNAALDRMGLARDTL